MKIVLVHVTLGLACLISPRWVLGQGYSLRLEWRAQSVDFRGVALDSVSIDSVVPSTSGGSQSPSGIAVTCSAGGAYCQFYRPGSTQRARPMSLGADLTMWGLGVAGLSLHGSARLLTDLADHDAWPGTSTPAQLLEGYAEYSRNSFAGRLGRQTIASRLGFIGFDGVRATYRGSSGWEVGGYGGLGLAEGLAIPVTSAALNPFDEFLPNRRQLVAGGSLAWSSTVGDARVEYQREVDRDTRNFVSERVAFSASVRPRPRWSIEGGTLYDLAYGWFGSSDLAVRYLNPRFSVTAGARRYRPSFDLWTIWGAFSPVPYSAINGSFTFTPHRSLQLRARGEAYRYDESGADTPLVEVERNGWRWSSGATLQPGERWLLDASYARDFGPGAQSRTWEGRVSFDPVDALALTANVGTVSRPLEFRFLDATSTWVGVGVTLRATDRLTATVHAIRYGEDRDRPDNAAFSWNQTRIDLRLSYSISHGADWAPLPPARGPAAP